MKQFSKFISAVVTFSAAMLLSCGVSAMKTPSMSDQDEQQTAQVIQVAPAEEMAGEEVQVEVSTSDALGVAAEKLLATPEKVEYLFKWAEDFESIISFEKLDFDTYMNECKILPKDFDIDDFEEKLICVTEILRSDQTPRFGMALDLRGDVAIVGDIHGDHESLKSVILQTQSWLDEDPNKDDPNLSRKVLFLGDVVDRGNTTLVLYYLCDFYLINLGKIFILSGNHETDMCVHDALEEDVLTIENEDCSFSWKEIIQDYFDELPCAAVINNTTFASHGGFPSVLCKDDVKRKDSCEKFFTTKVAKTKDLKYALLWEDLDENDMESLEGRLMDNGRISYSKKCLKKFFECANAIDLGDGRHLNLQHKVSGHQHVVGPWKHVDLGDGQTCDIVISTAKLLTDLMINSWLTSYNGASKVAVDGSILLVSGESAPVHFADVRYIDRFYEVFSLDDLVCLKKHFLILQLEQRCYGGTEFGSAIEEFVGDFIYVLNKFDVTAKSLDSKSLSEKVTVKNDCRVLDSRSLEESEEEEICCKGLCEPMVVDFSGFTEDNQNLSDDDSDDDVFDQEMLPRSISRMGSEIGDTGLIQSDDDWFKDYEEQIRTGCFY